MKNKRKAVILALVCIGIIILMRYVFSPYIDAYRINRHLDISGVKMLMTPSKVEEILGKGNPVGGFGAQFFEYDNAAALIAYPWNGFLRGKVGYIDIRDPKYGICGVRPGDSSSKAKDILERHGFLQDKMNKDTFRRGSAVICIFSDFVRINIEDWSLKGIVY